MISSGECAMAGRDGPLPRPPWHSWRAPPQARELFVTNEKGNSVTIVDGATRSRCEATCRSATGRAASSSAPTASSSTSAPRTTTRSRSWTRPAASSWARCPSGPDPEQMAISVDGKTLYVANEDDNMVTVIDIDSRTVVTEIPVGVEPEGMGVSHDGKWVVNTSETTNMAHFIDAETHEITDNVLVDQRPRYAEFTGDDAEVWVTAEVGGTVSVIDNTARKVTHRSVRGPGGAERGDRPGRRSGSPRTAASPSWRWGRQPGRGHRRQDLRGQGSTCWSGSASGSWRSARTRSSSTPPTACRTTSR